MKRSRFKEGQIIGILKEHQAGLGAKDLCRKHGVSDATFYKWRAKFGGMEVSDAKELKTLEAENVKPKKLLAEQMDWAMTQKGYRQRRACALAGIDPRVYRRSPTRSDDSDLQARLKDLSSERRQFGYRRLHVRLLRDRWQVNLT